LQGEFLAQTIFSIRHELFSPLGKWKEQPKCQKRILSCVTPFIGKKCGAGLPFLDIQNNESLPPVGGFVELDPVERRPGHSPGGFFPIILP
jgi:hypothetical protein